MSRVLVVDDDAVSRVVLRHMLSAQGFDVIEATSVDEALEILSHAYVDLIVCDYLMPQRNGLDLLEAIGSDSAPFVLLTGTRTRDQLNDSRVESVTAYLTKPVSTEELRQITAPFVMPQAA